ncbi:MBL fold metallo-hydrolase [Candidatus Avelusimicrobium stercoris]|mgnify:FL=1|uniref:MBL fold metallo-hydrolase n=1 Tax=Candidatus Avelusimicrobium stercoris TaxID=1947924 RepID=UPI003D1331BB
MNIDVINLGPMGNCTYLLSEGQDAILIDPAWDMNYLEHTLEEKKLNLLAVFFTHGHFDHVKFSQDLLQKHHLQAFLEENDLALSGLDPQFVHAYQGEQHLQIGPFAVHIIPTPGHTAGGVCLHIGNALFTGDTLFPGACGRVDLPSSNPRQMRQSLVKLSKLPEDTQIFSGHAYGGKCSSTIGYERVKNPFMRNAIRDEERL